MASLLLALIYLCFISLGLPDSLLGSAWPTIYQGMNVPLSFMGIVAFIISSGTITSALFSDRLTRRITSGVLTASSILLTAIGLLGFSLSSEFYQLCLWAIPYGLGAGGVDAALNNYVALHFKARHMSWLHCMWGVGATVSPLIMSFALSKGSWNFGYRIVFYIQIVLTAIVFLSLPLWFKMEKKEQKNEIEDESQLENKHLGVLGVFRLKGTLLLFLAFFCYCALESTSLNWAASFYTLAREVSAESAAKFASFGYLGMMIGRAINGFLTIRFDDKTLIRMGSSIILIGIILLCIPVSSSVLVFVAFCIIGLGCAPIYPCMIHSTPGLFGKENSQAIIGVQMAFAYTATLSMSPLFGLIAQWLGIYLLPYFLAFFLILMIVFYELTLSKIRKAS